MSWSCVILCDCNPGFRRNVESSATDAVYEANPDSGGAANLS